MQTTSNHATGTARPKADEQWHVFPDFERDAGPPRPHFIVGRECEINGQLFTA